MWGIQFKKVIRDILQNSSKSMLVISGIFFGVLGVGLILNSFLVIKSEVNENYMNTNPASFSLSVNKVDKNLVDSLKKFKSIENVEPRRMVDARIETGKNQWVTATLYVVDDFSDVKINTFTTEKGTANPKTGEISLERMDSSLVDKNIGDTVVVKTPLYNAKELKVTGIVHAAGLKPAWIEKNAYGFITEKTFDEIGDTSDYCQVLFTVSENKMNIDHIKNVMLEARKWCENNGYKVNQVDIPTPGEHPNAAQINALLFLFETFGVLALILSTILVINLITSLLSSQVRQIGVMKSMGASKFQIARMYYIFVIVLGIIAVLFAIPIAASLSRAIVDLCSQVLNFTVINYKIPITSYIVQIMAGVLIPILAATYPISKGCKITVNEALQCVNVDKSKTKLSTFSFKFGKKGLLSNIIIMSIRNTFRKRSRLILTVTSLAVGGAVFITAINLLASLNKTIDIAIKSLNYDSLFTLSQDYKTDDISAAVKNIKGVNSIEIYAGTLADLKYSDGTQSNTFQFIAFPKNAKSLNLPLMEGKRLSGSDTNEVVVNNLFIDAHPEYKVGDKISIDSNDKVTDWIIAGIVKETGGNQVIFANSSYYQRIFSDNGYGREVAFFYDKNNKISADSITENIEGKLHASGIDVLSKQTIGDVSSVFANHLKLIAGFLIVTSILIILVGVIGLISSTSINILERIREIGVMRAIGALPNKIAIMIIYENIILGLISFVGSCIIAIPLIIILSNNFGKIFLKAPLNIVYSPQALLEWFLATMLISITVSYFVAKNSQVKPVNELIGYE